MVIFFVLSAILSILLPEMCRPLLKEIEKIKEAEKKKNEVGRRFELQQASSGYYTTRNTSSETIMYIEDSIKRLKKALKKSRNDKICMSFSAIYQL